jgi:hypothetical protein
VIALSVILLLFSTSCETGGDSSNQIQKKPVERNLSIFLMSSVEDSKNINILLVCEPEDFKVEFETHYLTPAERATFVPWSQELIDEWAINEAREKEVQARRGLPYDGDNYSINVIDRRLVEQIIEEQKLGLNGLFESSAAIGRLASATHILHLETQANWRVYDRNVISQSRTLIDIETSFVKAVDVWKIIDLWDKETKTWNPAAKTYYLNERLIEFDTEVRQWFYVE